MPNKAPGPDGIPFRILRVLYEDMVELLWLLFDACLQHGYHPQAFCNSTTVILRKLGKADYRDLKVWHPITLLNTLGKALEVVVVGRI